MACVNLRAVSNGRGPSHARWKPHSGERFVFMCFVHLSLMAALICPSLMRPASAQETPPPQRPAALVPLYISFGVLQGRLRRRK